MSKWRETVAPVSNARISGLDEVFGEFQEPLTETQRLISGAPPSPIAKDASTKVEIADDVIEIRDDPTQEAPSSGKRSECDDLLEVTRTETIEIRTTKTYFVGGKKIGERVKTRTVESSDSIVRLSQSELDKKLSKPEVSVEFKHVPEKVHSSPTRRKTPSREMSQGTAPVRVELNDKSSEKSAQDESQSMATDFTQLFVKDEFGMAEETAGQLTRSSDDLDVGVRCFVKYDQFYYPAVVHELLGTVFSRDSFFNFTVYKNISSKHALLET